jgi:hypothetical protein
MDCSEPGARDAVAVLAAMARRYRWWERSDRSVVWSYWHLRLYVPGEPPLRRGERSALNRRYRRLA